MFNKNAKDPVADSVRKVMEQNNKERAAARAVNEKFGIVDRRALPHERQPEWDAAYKKVLSEGVETLNESDDLGPEKKQEKKKAKTYKHKTSGKEISAVQHPGKDWEAVNEEQVEEGLKMGDYGHEKEKSEKKKKDLFNRSRKMIAVSKILRWRKGKSDGTESVEQSRREDK